MTPLIVTLARARTAALFAALTLPALLLGADEPEPVDVFAKKYVEATPDVQLFDPAGLTMGDLTRKVLVKGVIAVAANAPSASHERHSKAIALALQIEPDNEQAIAVNSLLRDRRSPAKVVEFRNNFDVMEVLWLGIGFLNDGSEDDQELAGYLLDLLVMMGPKDQEMVLAAEAHVSSGGVDWAALFPPPPPPPSEVKQREMELLKFTRVESAANALLLMETGAIYEGKPVAISVRAVRDDPVRDRVSRVDFEFEGGYRSNDFMRNAPPLVIQRAGEKWPKGYDVEIAIPGEFAVKDLGSASVAAALALEGLVDGKPRDPKFAVAGFLGESGSVTRCGGIWSKLLGAVEAGCTHIAIPKDNVADFPDMVVGEGVAPFVKVQVFSIESYDEAALLSLDGSERDFLVNESMRLFDETREVLTRGNPGALLKSPDVQQRLAKILELTPNHFSAKLLQLVSQGGGPKTYSLGASYLRIEPLVKEAKRSNAFSDKLDAELKSLGRDRLIYHEKTLGVIKAIDLLLEADNQRRLKIATTGLKRQTWQQVRDEGIDLLDAAFGDMEADPELDEWRKRLDEEPLKPDGTAR